MSFSMEHSENKASSLRPEIHSVAGQAQALLALRALHEMQPDLAIDIEHPENNSRELRNQAMKLWVEEFSAKFRKYIEDPRHAHEQIDLSDAEALNHLLSELRSTNNGSDTVH